jgi:hypothetical protein
MKAAAQVLSLDKWLYAYIIHEKPSKCPDPSLEVPRARINILKKK